jgi:hypothetical protein
VVFLLMFAMAGISGYVSWAFSSVRKARNFVRTSWNNVETANGQRAEVVTQVIARIGHHLPAEHLDNLRRAHERIATAVGPRGSDHADGQLRLALAAIWDTQQLSADFTECKAKADAANRVVDDVARVYNGHVTDYEKLRKTESRKMVCELVGFDKESYFARATAGSPADSISEIAARAPQGIAPPPTIAGFEGLPDPMNDPSLGLLPAGKIDRNPLGHSFQPPSTATLLAATLSTRLSTQDAPAIEPPLVDSQFVLPRPILSAAGPSIAAQLLTAQLSAAQHDQFSTGANFLTNPNVGEPDGNPTPLGDWVEPNVELEPDVQVENDGQVENDVQVELEVANDGQVELEVEAAPTFEAWTPPVLGAPISRPVDPFRHSGEFANDDDVDDEDDRWFRRDEQIVEATRGSTSSPDEMSTNRDTTF